jgi:hypothetical protein
MATNEVIPVTPYGTPTETITYDNAVGYADWFLLESKDHHKIGLARIAKDCFELVGFSENADGETIGCDSEYVTIEVGRRLIKDGKAVLMVLAKDVKDFDDEATVKQLEKEQLGD